MYGYRKDDSNRSRLVIDEFAADVVRDIFKWRIEGLSNQGIANRLNSMGVLSPYEYKRECGMRFSTSFKTGAKATWSANSVARVLKNEVYTGVLEQAKRTSRSYKINDRIDKPKEQWIRVEGTHEPVVSKADFDLVSELLKHDVRVAPAQEAVYIFAGLLKCKDCGQNMVRKSVPGDGRKYVYFVCVSNKSYKSCSPHNISEKIVEQAVLQTIQSHIGNALDFGNILRRVEALPMTQPAVRKLDKQAAAKRREILKYQTRKAKLYEDLQDGILDEEEYTKYKADFTRLHSEAEQALDRLNNEMEEVIHNRTPEHTWISNFKERGNIVGLSRDILVKLVDKIFVYEGNKLEIRLKYQFPFDIALTVNEEALGIWHAKADVTQMN
ncbi:MAG: recombinase family protein [Defluviitaleaceae bacterium]|nr:recombinase family protein [Defluviitaleaceae bacterium]